MKTATAAVILALPVIGVLLLAADKQVAISTATAVRVPIVGYDPRDLMYGHYLRFRFEGPMAIDDDPHEYFIPEGEAKRLENLLADRAGHVVELDVYRTGNGGQSYGMLYIDGQPWRDYLAAHPEPEHP